MRHAAGLAAGAMVLACTVGASAEPLPRFPPGAVWNQDISGAPKHPSSDSMIATLAGINGGFGNGRMQIDFSLHVVRAPSGAATRTIVAHPGGYYDPDCEAVGASMPVPANAAIEGQTDLICDNINEDCHLLVEQDGVLYEAYQVTAGLGATLEARCLAIWDLSLIYPAEGRGDHCTSADAAGFPMSALLFNADEIAASLAADATGGGDIGHAVRFILPNGRMASDGSLGGVGGRLYVRPATHAGGPSGPVGSVPYGARLRLRPDFPMTGYPVAAQVVLHTFMRYGIVLADGGNIALTAESDLYTTTRWTDLGIDSRVFDLTPGTTPVSVSDFEVVDTGDRIPETYDCLPTSPIFLDNFESGDVTMWSSAVP